MPSATIVAKMLFLIAGLHVGGYAEGVGAYYAPGLMQQVCEHRASHGWNDLDCSWPCLVSAIEPEDVGKMFLVYHESLSFHL